MQELTLLKTRLHQLTEELISRCPYCTAVSHDLESKTPVYCTKWSGSSHPVSVNPATCLSCGEFRRSNPIT